MPRQAPQARIRAQAELHRRGQGFEGHLAGRPQVELPAGGKGPSRREDPTQGGGLAGGDADRGQLLALVGGGGGTDALQQVGIAAQTDAVLEATAGDAESQVAAAGAAHALGQDRRQGLAVEIGVAAVAAVGAEQAPALAETLVEHPLQLAQALVLVGADAVAGGRQFDQVAAAVAEGSRQAEAVPQGQGVADRGDHRAQGRRLAGIDLAVEQQGVAAADQAGLEQGGHATELTGAVAAVVADGQIALPGLAPGFDPHQEHGLGRIAAQAGQIAAHFGDTGLPAQQLQIPLHLRQVQHPAPQWSQQLLYPSRQPGVGAAHLDLDDATLHHLEAARGGLGAAVHPTVDVAIGDQPGREGGGTGLQTLVAIGDGGAGGQDRGQDGGGIGAQTADGGLASWYDGDDRALWSAASGRGRGGRTVRRRRGCGLQVHRPGTGLGCWALVHLATTGQPHRTVLQRWGNQLGQQQRDHGRAVGCGGFCEMDAR